MDVIRDGYFTDTNELWPGIANSFQIDKVLFHEKSKYQDVLVCKTTNHGVILVLDDCLQCTEQDEFAYQEMAALVPLNCHPNPEKVLIIGGGDGGVAREVGKHPLVKSIIQCEIDQVVIDACKKYIPSMACGFENPKLTLHVGDGFHFMEKHKGEFDVIITDSSDPIGPAKSLFEKPYYQLMKEALKPNGIIGTQGESQWLFLDLIKDVQNFGREIFPKVGYYYTTVPSYPSGQIGHTIMSLNPDTDFTKPLHTFTYEEVEDFGWKYYNSDVHGASFVLPRFSVQALND